MLKSIFILIVGVYMQLQVFAQGEIYSKSFIKAIADQVNDYQYSHPWQEFDDNWIRGTYYTGVMAVYQATGDENYLRQCDNWGEKLGWQIPKLKPGQKASGVNLLTCGQTWLESYMVQKKKYKIESILAHLDDAAVRNAVSEPLEWYYEGGERYVDGLFTGPPALVMLYKITGKEKYLDWMDACFWDVYGTLFDIKENLFYRDVRYMPCYSDEDPERWVRPDSIPYEEAIRSSQLREV